MFIKYGSAKIIASYENEVALLEVKPDLEKILENFKVIKLDPQRYMYLRNRSVSSLETWGPNKNGDGFPRQELKDNHHTFINSRVSVDHKDIVVGAVIDSYFVKPSVEVVENKIVKAGDYVENILAIDKKVAESYKPDGKNSLLKLIMDGIVTDTSMGAIVGYSICSVPTCLNVAHTEDEYCEHIKFKKNSMIRVAGDLEVQVYEICKNVTFFEDSIIVPLEYGGLAGGEGADPQAKFLEKIATTPLKSYIIYRDKFVKTAQIDIGMSEEQKKIFIPEKQLYRQKFDDKDIEYTKERMKKNLEEELNKEVVVEKDTEKIDNAYEYIIELLKKGTPFDEALKLAWEHYKGVKEKEEVKKAVKRQEVIVVDMDGTLMDISHRLHYIESEEKDWKSFFKEEEVMKDKPNLEVVEFVKQKQKETGLPVVVLTGRPESLREVTEKQLKDLGIEYIDLIMKPKEKTHEKSYVFKPDALKEYKPVVFIDDEVKNIQSILNRFGKDVEVYLVEDGKVKTFKKEIEEVKKEASVWVVKRLQKKIL